jgi:hypothetical protein
MDIAYVTQRMVEAKRKVEEEYGKRLRGNKKGKEILAVIKQAPVGFSDNTRHREIDRFMAQYPEATIFMSPEFEAENINSAIGHEMCHLMQKLCGVADKHPLTLEAAAYYVSEKCMKRSMTEAQLKLMHGVISELREGVEINKAINAGVLDFFGLWEIDDRLKGRSMSDKGLMLRSPEFYDAVERKTFYKFYKDVTRGFLGYETSGTGLAKAIEDSLKEEK